MSDFSLQSGYSVAFLKFIVIAESFDGIGLLLPWTAVAALIGLTIDMFGAFVTHVHNRDPLNDSTGALGMLIRLIAVGILWALRQRNGFTLPTLRSSTLRVTAVTAACLVLAICGSSAVRHVSSKASGTVVPVTK